MHKLKKNAAASSTAAAAASPVLVVGIVVTAADSRTSQDGRQSLLVCPSSCNPSQVIHHLPLVPLSTNVLQPHTILTNAYPPMMPTLLLVAVIQ